MRQTMQLTFQALTNSPKFLNTLFVITFLQVAVFGHYYQHSQRNNFVKASDIQEEDLQTNQAYEAALKEVLPFFRIYFTDSAKKASVETFKLIGKIHSPIEARIIQKKMIGNIPLQIEGFFDSTLNLPKFILGLLNNKENILFETMDSEELILKVLPLSSGKKVFFHLKNGNAMPSMEPDPFNHGFFFVSAFEEAQESFIQGVLEALPEEQKDENRLSASLIRNIGTMSEKKR